MAGEECYEKLRQEKKLINTSQQQMLHAPG